MQFIQRRVIIVFLGLDAMVKGLETSQLKIEGLKGELFKYSQDSHLGVILDLVAVTLESRSNG